MDEYSLLFSFIYLWLYVWFLGGGGGGGINPKKKKKTQTFPVNPHLIFIEITPSLIDNPNLNFKLKQNPTFFVVVINIATYLWKWGIVKYY